MLNMDFSQALAIDTRALAWQPSPAQGVWRKPLARAAAECGHATSIVRFDPGASFPSHDHPRGEEILVLSGTFSDELGDYGAGSYLRNPAGFRHGSFSREGCEIFVKLHQFQRSDTTQVRIDTRREPWQPGYGRLQVMPLHDHLEEHTALVRWPAGERFHPHQHRGGEEILVLEGELIDERGRYPEGYWLRSPHLSEHCPRTETPTLIWVKVGHLPA